MCGEVHFRRQESGSSVIQQKKRKEGRGGDIVYIV
jgi:hypothetical protein